ncbi:putative Galactose mutarotase like Glycosyl hydrolases family 31 [Trypanosoma vivax]|uniref:Glucosidase II subunit alpha n=1 Tax=Trypanosoma vivax (strain Y486) TaxID=1055687 RepID=G0U4B5_TRYVY|nr:putative Galactose mutarotase like Glycosyl hydrolases family 31 [Trypanosoma vivax]CCC52278.1 putative glucosidase [Trypanosoma vivax Y486]
MVATLLCASGQRLMSVLVFVLLLMGASCGQEISKVNSNFVADVSHYGDGIMRLVLKPTSDWFYQVESVIMRDAVGGTLNSTCSGTSCITYSKHCTLRTSTEAEKFTASYQCNDIELSTVKIALQNMESPTVHLSFPTSRRLYGIPEHAMDLTLKGNTTYSMYNTDAFQYRINDPQPLYGSIPFLLAHSKEASTGILFLNSAGMKVEVVTEGILGCKWSTEAGLVDLFFFPGSTPALVQQQHASITGNTAMPPYFSLGYHQCRWNYRSTDDCLAVDQGFDKHNLPYDVLWLDIEHTDNKKYFTWDKYVFPDPKALVESLVAKGRKLVTIKDPHVKVEDGYYVHDEATKGDYYIKDSSGESPYRAQCWPGRSSWVDFYNKRARDWYATLFRHDRYEAGSHDVHSWVDMNEPSVFEGPEKTIHRDAKHVSDSGKLVENRYIHNMYSLYNVMAVHQGHIESSRGLPYVMRPFILTRSFFSGSQRYAAMWTGDNMAKWDHLQNSFPELLSLSVSNYVFVGADIGGFFFDPSEELFVRWMQAGVFYPFMRSHSHLETKRREPWVYGEVATDRIRAALALRYSLVPYLYTQFLHSHKNGTIIMRPLFYEFPHEESFYDEQYTFMFGPSLLVSPVLNPGEQEKSIPIPSGSKWYSYSTGEVVPPGSFRMPVDMDTIPMFIRGGHIIPAKLRMRRATFSTKQDPFTLYVALNDQGNSVGDLFIDDGETFNFEHGGFIHRRFALTHDRLTSSPFPGTSKSLTFTVTNRVERIVIFGFQGKPEKVLVEEIKGHVATGREIEFEIQGGSLILRNPDVLVSDDWSIFLKR